jgi:hypothetical protein
MVPAIVVPDDIDGEQRVAAPLPAAGSCRFARRRRCAMVVAFTCVVTAGVLAMAYLPLIDWMIAILKWVQDLGSWAPLFVIGLYGVGALVTAPGTPMHFGCGALFGLGWGLAINICAYTFGSACGFLLGRYLLQARVHRVSAIPSAFPVLWRSSLPSSQFGEHDDQRLLNWPDRCAAVPIAVRGHTEAMAAVAADLEQSTGTHGVLVPTERIAGAVGLEQLPRRRRRAGPHSRAVLRHHGRVVHSLQPDAHHSRRGTRRHRIDGSG